MPYDQIPKQFRLGPPEGFVHIYMYEVFAKGYEFQLSLGLEYGVRDQIESEKAWYLGFN